MRAILCAALCAREQGASVLILESAPRHMRGGNSRHTRNLRAMHEAPTDVLTEAYPEEEYFADLMRVTGGITKEPLARLTIRESAQCPKADEGHFQNIDQHRYFNTNNLWIDLQALKAALEANDGLIPLPPIMNKKTVDPRDATSPAVVQLETAMGAAIE